MVSVNDRLMGVNWGNEMPRMPARHYRHPQRKGKRHGAPGVARRWLPTRYRSFPWLPGKQGLQGTRGG